MEKLIKDNYSAPWGVLADKINEIIDEVKKQDFDNIFILNQYLLDLKFKEAVKKAEFEAMKPNPCQTHCVDGLGCAHKNVCNLFTPMAQPLCVNSRVCENYLPEYRVGKK